MRYFLSPIELPPASWRPRVDDEVEIREAIMRNHERNSALRRGAWPRAQWQYFSFQGGIDAQVRDEIEGGRLVARFSNQVRYGRKGRGNGQT